MINRLPNWDILANLFGAKILSLPRFVAQDPHTNNSISRLGTFISSSMFLASKVLKVLVYEPFTDSCNLQPLCDSGHQTTKNTRLFGKCSCLRKKCCQQTITHFHLQWICPELHVFPTHPWRKDRNIHDRYNMFNMISGWWYTYPSEKYELVSWDI